MGLPWYNYGTAIGSPLDAHGLPMGYQRATYRVPMGRSWVTHGLLIGYPNRPLGDYLWISHGLPQNLVGVYEMLMNY